MTQPSSQFRPLGDEQKHLWMARRMAKTVGVDLAAAYEAGTLSQEEWAETVQRCRGCDWAEGCDHWLPEHAEGVEHAPRACVNADLWDRLKP